MLLWKRWHFHLGHNKLEVCVALALSDSSAVGGQAALVPLPPLLSHHTEVRAVAGLRHLEPKFPVLATARNYLHASLWCGQGERHRSPQAPGSCSRGRLGSSLLVCGRGQVWACAWPEGPSGALERGPCLGTGVQALSGDLAKCPLCPWLEKGP